MILEFWGLQHHWPPTYFMERQNFAKYLLQILAEQIQQIFPPWRESQIDAHCSVCRLASWSLPSLNPMTDALNVQMGIDVLCVYMYTYICIYAFMHIHNFVYLNMYTYIFRIIVDSPIQ